jgi:hypothetical protein
MKMRRETSAIDPSRLIRQWNNGGATANSNTARSAIQQPDSVEMTAPVLIRDAIHNAIHGKRDGSYFAE